MSRNFLKPVSAARRAFSLVEVVVAVGIIAVAVIAIVGLLLPNLKAVDEQIETDVARRLSENIQSELTRYARTVLTTSNNPGLNDFEAGFFNGAAPTRSIFMVATRDGSRVLVTGEDPYQAWNNTYNNPYRPNDAGNYDTVEVADARTAENNLISHDTPGNPPGIAFRDRYFLIEVFLPKSPAYRATTVAGNVGLAFLPVGVRVVWPYRLPVGPGNPSGTSLYNSRGTNEDELAWLVVPPSQHSVYSFNFAIAP